MSFLRDAAVDLVVSLKGLTLTREAEIALHVLSNEIARSVEVEENQKKRKHSCPDWDYMVIDKDSPEFDACLCYTKEQDPTAHLWECLGRWSSYLVTQGKQAELAPPQWLCDAIESATKPLVLKKEWEGLTEEDIYDAMDNEDEFDFAKAIEAKLKEKNTF